MSTHRSYSREEQALDEFIKSTDETVVVCLTEPFHPGSQIMADRVRKIANQMQNLHTIVIGMETHRPWAEKHKAYGTPTALVFKKHKVTRRLTGVLSEEQLQDMLRGL